MNIVEIPLLTFLFTNLLSQADRIF